MDTLITAVAAAIGAVVGGVGSQMVRFTLDKRVRQQIREEERRKDLRQMFEGMIHVARAQKAALLRIDLAPVLGQSLEQVQGRHTEDLDEVTNRYPYFALRLHRVEDEELRSLGKELEHAIASLGISLKTS